MNISQARLRSAILKALGHPIRILLVHELSRGDRCVCELNRLADVNPSNISRHLARLKTAGIVTDRRDGMNVFYHLACPCILRAVDCTLEVLRTQGTRRRSPKENR